MLKKGHANQEIRIPGQRIKLSIMNQHPLDLTDYLKFRKDYLEIIINFQNSIISYEKLLIDPDFVIKGLLKTLGIDFSQELINALILNSLAIKKAYRKFA